MFAADQVMQRCSVCYAVRHAIAYDCVTTPVITALQHGDCHPRGRHLMEDLLMHMKAGSRQLARLAEGV